MEFKGPLKIVVLKLLYKRDMTGYGLIKQIKEKTGFWKPSPGSIYPLMNELAKKGLVHVKHDKNQKVYSITPKGKNVFDKLKTEREKAVETIKNHLRILELIEDKKEIGRLRSVIDLCKKEGPALRENISGLVELQLNVLNAIKEKKDIKKISKLIKETSKKIKNL
jgi:DNA-binding PadR family transcriptional regulator